MGKVLTCLPVLLAVACGAYAQDPLSPDERVEVVLDGDTSPAITLGRVDVDDVDIEIDGRLSEGIWREQPVLGDYRIVEPDTPRRAGLRN